MDRLWVKILVYPMVGLSLFVFFFWLTFPNAEIEKIAKTRLEAALDNKYNVEFDKFGISGISGIKAEGISFRSKAPPLDISDAERKKFKPINMTLTSAEGSLSLIKTLSGSPAADFEVELGGGTLEGTYAQVSYEPVVEKPKRSSRRRPKSGAKPGADKKDKEGEDADKAEEEEGDKMAQGHQIDAIITEIPLLAITVLQSYVGSPLKGTLGGTLMMLMSQQGHLLDMNTDLKISRVSYGPGELPFDTGFGKFKLNTPLNVGDLVLKVHVENGKLIIDEFSSTGPDLIIEAEGNIRLGASFTASRVQVNMRLKPAQKFLKENDLDAILGISPKIRNAKAGDWYGVLISGPLGKLSFHPSSRTAGGLGKSKPGRKKK